MKGLLLILGGAAMFVMSMIWWPIRGMPTMDILLGGIMGSIWVCSGMIVDVLENKLAGR